MDKGMGRSAASVARVPATSDGGKEIPGNAAIATPREFEGIVHNGVVELLNGKLPEGTRVQVRTKK
jgi:hypothetical protein